MRAELAAPAVIIRKHNQLVSLLLLESFYKHCDAEGTSENSLRCVLFQPAAFALKSILHDSAATAAVVTGAQYLEPPRRARKLLFILTALLYWMIC